MTYIEMYEHYIKMFDNALSSEEITPILETITKTMIQKYADKIIEENMYAESLAGNEPVLVRSYNTGACAFCRMLAGEHVKSEGTEWGDFTAPNGYSYFTRHSNCNCKLLYTSKRGVRSVVQNYKLTEEQAKQRANKAAMKKLKAEKEKAEKELDEVARFYIQKRLKGEDIT